MSRAEFLKQRYNGIRGISALRELFAINYFNLLLPPRYIAVFSGIGSGTSEYIAQSYTGVSDKWDITVYDRETVKPVAYIDVTGYRDPREAKGDSQRCILSVKQHIARDTGILGRLWYAHFTDTKHILVMLSATRLQQYIDRGITNKRYLYRDEYPVYCLPINKWQDPHDFILWLKNNT